MGFLFAMTPPLSTLPAHPSVDLIVLNWNGKQYLEVCLTSLLRQTYSNYRVIFVDNDSHDGSVEFVRAHFPTVEIIVNRKNLGFAAGNNVALRKSLSDLVGLINNDIDMSPNWLEEIVKGLQQHPNAAGAAGTICALDNLDRVMFTLTKIDPYTATAYWINQESPPRYVDYLAGNCTVVRRDVIGQVGLLDEDYFCYYEDTDWGARLIRAGYDLIYVPTARMGHKEQGSAPSSLHYYLMHRNRCRFALKNFDIDLLPGFLRAYAADLRKEWKQNQADKKPELNRLLARGIAWNLAMLPKTLWVRWLDRIRTGNRRSYNRNMPLRNIQADGRGGYVDGDVPAAVAT
jgi:GT2 family glycosyltransferase